MWWNIQELWGNPPHSLPWSSQFNIIPWMEFVSDENMVALRCKSGQQSWNVYLNWKLNCQEEKIAPLPLLAWVPLNLKCLNHFPVLLMFYETSITVSKSAQTERYGKKCLFRLCSMLVQYSYCTYYLHVKKIMQNAFQGKLVCFIVSTTRQHSLVQYQQFFNASKDLSATFSRKVFSFGRLRCNIKQFSKS